MSQFTRMTKDDRRAQLLATGVALAETYGTHGVTQKMIGEQVGCSPGLLYRYFGTIEKFRSAVMTAAVRSENLRVIGRGLATNDRRCLRLDPAIQKRALASLSAPATK